MATVVKNFRIKSGLVVEGATGTINGQNILTETGGNAYILNLVGGAALVKSVEATQLEVNGDGKLSVKSGVFDASGSAAAAQSAATTAAASDATTKANAAQSAATTAAASDATTKVAAEAALRVSGDAASVSTAAADATSKANAAQAAAEATAAASLSSAISTEVSNRNTAISGAVSTLVDGAPDLLNTLNELAAAINDDANYTTTITTALATKATSAQVATDIAAEAALRVSGDAASVSTAAADATTKANAAQAAAVSTAAADATTKANAAQVAAELTADQNLNAVTQGTTRFAVVNISNATSQKASKISIESAGAAVAYSWLKADFPTAKAIVKFETATHTQVSEVLLSSDASNNIAITEYASVSTNGDLATISASYAQGYINIDVITVNPNTTVTTMLTLIK